MRKSLVQTGAGEAKCGDCDNQVALEIEERGIYFRKLRHGEKPFLFSFILFFNIYVLLRVETP